MQFPGRSLLRNYKRSPLGVLTPLTSVAPPAGPMMVQDGFSYVSVGAYIDEWEQVSSGADWDGHAYRTSFYIPFTSFYVGGAKAIGRFWEPLFKGVERWVALGDFTELTSFGTLLSTPQLIGKNFYVLPEPTSATVVSTSLSFFKAQDDSLIPSAPVSNGSPTTKIVDLNSMLYHDNSFGLNEAISPTGGGGVAAGSVPSGTVFQSVYATLVTSVVQAVFASATHVRTIPYDGRWTGRLVLTTEAL